MDLDILEDESVEAFIANVLKTLQVVPLENIQSAFDNAIEPQPDSFIILGPGTLQ